MGIRLRGFDYSRPYFYMVTVKRRAGYPAFGRVVGDPTVHYLEPNWITWLFVDIIKTFHETWYCIEPITCFAIMPDHIHLLIKIRATEKRVGLPVIVRMLTRALEKAYFATAAGMAAGKAAAGTTPNEGRQGGEAGKREMAAGKAAAGTTPTEGRCGGEAGKSGAVGRSAGQHLYLGRSAGQHLFLGRSAGQHLFEFDWHDWIVSRDGQLSTFTCYIRENAWRSWRRQSHREYFQRVNEISFLGRHWYGYGNAALLDLPVIEPFRCSRTWIKGGAEWNEAVSRAARLGPGGAGIGTFMSPCEKACGHALGLAGGRWIVLSPDGFGERWHPGRHYEAFCAEGRMLFLSLYPTLARQPTNAELYHRCHEMGDIVVEGLAGRVLTRR